MCFTPNVSSGEQNFWKLGNVGQEIWISYRKWDLDWAGETAWSFQAMWYLLVTSDLGCVRKIHSAFLGLSTWRAGKCYKWQELQHRSLGGACTPWCPLNRSVHWGWVDGSTKNSFVWSYLNTRTLWHCGKRGKWEARAVEGKQQIQMSFCAI